MGFEGCSLSPIGIALLRRATRSAASRRYCSYPVVSPAILIAVGHRGLLRGLLFER